MWKQTLPLLAATMVVATAYAADAPRMQAIEQAIEASSGDVRLPDRMPATFFVRPCSECPVKTLQITQATQFLLGNRAATQAVFNRFVQQAPLTLGIFYASKTSDVTRVIAFDVADGVAASPAAGKKTSPRQNRVN